MKITEVQIIKTRSEKVRARADIHFEWFWLKGFKVLFDEDKKRNFLTPPSYLSGMGWRALFKTDEKKDWEEIQEIVLKEYEEYELRESTEDL